MPSVLFVCMANMNRSPMASALFKRMVSQLPDADSWRVESAGTWALDGEAPAPKAEAIMQEMGFDIHEHNARTVTDNMLRSFDLILTMEAGQKEALRAEFLDSANRVYMLTEMSGPGYDIDDPIGGSMGEFRNTALELKVLIEKGFEKICSLARENAAPSS